MLLDVFNLDSCIRFSLPQSLLFVCFCSRSSAARPSYLSVSSFPTPQQFIGIQLFERHEGPSLLLVWSATKQSSKTKAIPTWQGINDKSRKRERKKEKDNLLERLQLDTNRRNLGMVDATVQRHYQINFGSREHRTLQGGSGNSTRQFQRRRCRDERA